MYGYVSVLITLWSDYDFCNVTEAVYTVRRQPQNRGKGQSGGDLCV